MLTKRTTPRRQFLRLGTALALMLVGCDDGLPEIMVAPTFELVAEDGEPFGSRQLTGHVWVASFLFTSCTGVCPTLSGQIANLTRRLSDVGDARFVSFSVDPEVDRPEVLHHYAEMFGADPRWRFVTGPREEIRSAVVDGFHVSMGEREQLRVGYDIPHSNQLFLIDQNGVVRGQYPTDGPGLRAIERDVRRLMERPPATH